MGANSAIEWLNKWDEFEGRPVIIPGHTINFWEGCCEVDDGCSRCYAHARDKRNLIEKVDHWGKNTPRRRIKNWDKFLQWNSKAKAEGVRPYAFAMSLGDFLEDHPQPYEWRPEAIDVLEQLTNLDILMLTKRPWNAFRFLPTRWFNGEWPKHIAFGVSVSSPKSEVERKLYTLRQIPAPMKFVSYEPAVAPVDWTGWEFIDWLIGGGESEWPNMPPARPMHPDCMRSARDWAKRERIPFHFKQWGEYLPLMRDYPHQNGKVKVDGRSWPYKYDDSDPRIMYAKMGKNITGRQLDGVEHNGWPKHWRSW